MKKLVSIFLLVFCTVFLTGCVDLKINEELTINQDGSMDHSIQFLSSDNMLIFEKEIKDGFTKTLSEKGFGNLSPVKEMDYFGVKGSNHIDKTGKIGYFDLSSCYDSSNKYFHLIDNSVDYFLFKYYDLTVNVDVDGMFSDVNNEMVTLSEYKFTLNLPVKILESNANNVYNNNQSATWLLSIGGKNSIHAEFIVINIQNIVILTCSLVLLLILLIVLLILKKKKRLKNK